MAPAAPAALIALTPAVFASWRPLPVATMLPARPFTSVGTRIIRKIAAKVRMMKGAASLRVPAVCTSAIIVPPIVSTAPMTPPSTRGMSAKPRVNFAHVEKRSLVALKSRQAMKTGASDTAMARPILAIPETRIATQAISAPSTPSSTDRRLIDRKPLSSAERSEKSKIAVTISSSASLRLTSPLASSRAPPIEAGTLVTIL